MSDLADDAIYQDKTKLLAMIQRAHQKAQEAREPWETLWKRAWRMYHGQHDKTMLQTMYGRDSWPFESTLFLPWAKEQVETNVPRLTAGLTSDDMPFRARPLITDYTQIDESQWSAACDEAQALLCNQLYEDVQFGAQVEDWNRIAEIYGTAPLLLDWWKEDGAGQSYDQLRVRMLSPYDVWPDPRGKCIHKWEQGEPVRYIQIMLRETVDWLYRLMAKNPAKQWQMDKAAIERCLGRMKGEYDKQRGLAADTGRLGETQGDGYTPTDDEDRRVLPLLIHFERDRWVWMIGVPPYADILLTEIGKGQYPYYGAGIPMVRYMTNRLPFEFWGMSTVLDVAPLNHAANYMLNCALTNAYRSTNQTILIDGQAELDDMVAQPCGRYKVAPGVRPDTAVHVIPWPTLLADFWRYHNIFDLETQKIGTAPDFTQGMQGSTPDTARGTLALMGEVNTKYKAKIRTARQCLGTLGRLMWEVDKIFITEDRLIPLFGEREAKVKYVTFGVEQFQRRFRIKFDTRDKATNAALRVQQMQSWMAMHQQDPSFPMHEADWDMAKLLEVQEPARYLGVKATHPQYENQMLLQYGEMPPVKPNHPHEAHLQEHQAEDMVRAVQQLPPDQQAEYEYHVRDHVTFLTGVAPGQMPGMEGAEGMGGMPPAEGAGGAPPAEAMEPGVEAATAAAPGLDAGIAPEQTNLEAPSPAMPEPPMPVPPMPGEGGG